MSSKQTYKCPFCILERIKKVRPVEERHLATMQADAIFFNRCTLSVTQHQHIRITTFLLCLHNAYNKKLLYLATIHSKYHRSSVV